MASISNDNKQTAEFFDGTVKSVRFSGKDSGDVLVVPVFYTEDASKAEIVPQGADLDKKLDGALTRAIESDPKFDGKAGQSLILSGLANSPYAKIVLVGCGKPEAMDDHAAEALGSRIYQLVGSMGYENVSVLANYCQISFRSLGTAPVPFACQLASGFLLKSYTFDKYRSNRPAAATNNLNIVVNPQVIGKVRDSFTDYAASIRGAFWARDLANEPPNVLTPKAFAQNIRDELQPLGVCVRILEEDEMERLGMGAAIAVGKGSAHPPRMVIMEYDGTFGQDSNPPLALVGKGLTFDTGGVQSKGASMNTMKFDMGGAAAVVGAMRSLAERNAAAKVVAIVGLAENGIDGLAYRPDDIVTSLSGKTIEIGHTDAEGRLVLADAMTYIQREYKPHSMIDLATLTGACLMALGNTYAGVFSNDNSLAGQIETAGKKVNELTWRLPLHANFRNATLGTVADLTNSGGRPGASTAAAFLQEFVEDGVKWAHIDIAGMAMGVSGHATLPDRIGTGYGVRLLDRLVAEHYEQKRMPTVQSVLQTPQYKLGK